MNRSLLLFLSVLVLIATVADGKRLNQEQEKLLSKKPHIEKIIITGNYSFSEKKIKSKLYSHEDGFLQSVKLKGKNRYSKVSFSRDKVLLDYFYRSEGFIDVEISVDFTAGSKNQSVVVLINIYEGTRYRINKINITGELGYFSWPIHASAKKLKPGEYLNYYLLEDAKQAIKAVCANRGYPYAVIDITLDKNARQGTVAININVARGNLVVFGDVVLDTTLTISPRIFEKEIAFKTNERYSRDKFLLSQQQLIRTNLFSYVTLQAPDSMSAIDSLMPEFRVRAIERMPKYVNLATGAGQDPQKDLVWDFRGAFGNRNIGGTARKVHIEASSSFQVITDWRPVKVHLEFGYTEPYLFGIRMPLLTTFYFEPRISSPVQDYQIESVGMKSTAIREFSLTTRLLVSVTHEQFNITPENKTESDSEEGISINRKFILHLDRDTRPLYNKFNPNRGSYTQYHLEYVGGILGGDDSFLKLVFEWAKYNKLGGQAVFVSRIRLGWVNEFGKSEYIPSRDLFYIGGANTIRGFAENSVGPCDVDGDPEGGEAIALFNLEIRRPLFRSFWHSFFLDSGFNVDKLKNVSYRDVVISAGAGLQFMSPVGPIRLDYGRKVTINNIEPGGRFHVSILYAF